MSFLRRIAERAGGPGTSGLLVPKRRADGASRLRRVAEEPAAEEIEEAGAEEAQPRRLSRQAEEEAGEEEVQTHRLSRQAEEEAGEEEMQTHRLSRQAEEEAGEEEVQTRRLSRQAEEEGEEEVQTHRLSRQAEEEAEEEPAMPLRAVARQATEEEEEPLQAVRAPSEEEMAPENATPPDEAAAEPEPSDLRAVRREVAVAPGPVGESLGFGGDPTVGAEAEAAESAAAFGPPAPAPWHDLETAAHESAAPPAVEEHSPPRAATTERPQVLIEQLDVLIHEPQAAAPAAGDAGGLTRRALRARYLRRL